MNASGSSLPLVIFGGFGSDTITGGTNNDIIFGDFGRVQYIDPVSGAMVATLGFGGRGRRDQQPHRRSAVGDLART